MNLDLWAQTVHAVAGMLWVGGIFFAYMALRPAAEGLAPPERLALWRRTFSRFFPWVWLFIGLLLASGYWDLFARFGGFGGPRHLAVMHWVGLLMAALFTYLYFLPYRALGRALTAGDLAAAAAAMRRIRPVMAINLGLGIFNTLVGVAGPALG